MISRAEPGSVRTIRCRKATKPATMKSPSISRRNGLVVTMLQRLIVASGRAKAAAQLPAAAREREAAAARKIMIKTRKAAGERSSSLMSRDRDVEAMHQLVAVIEATDQHARRYFAQGWLPAAGPLSGSSGARA